MVSRMDTVLTGSRQRWEVWEGVRHAVVLSRSVVCKQSGLKWFSNV